MTESERETIFNPDDDSDAADATLMGSLHQRAHPRHLTFTPLLICLEGGHRGMRYTLKAKEQIIGRSRDADIRLDDELVSRQHARIVWHNFGTPQIPPYCTIEDLGSRNGTELNGVPLLAPTQLRERDRILVGTTLLGFFLRDATEAELERSLYDLATKDALTGLDNRHQFNAMLVHHVERARRYERPLALLIIDADRFKRINDEFGHDVGDRALVQLARVISTSCRASEICARWGGEEFAVLCPETTAEGAITLAERIRQRVRIFPLEHDDRLIPLSVSIGGAMLQAEDNADTLFRRADQSLLRAKEIGRNRTVFENKPVGLDHTATFTGRRPNEEPPND